MVTDKVPGTRRSFHERVRFVLVGFFHVFQTFGRRRFSGALHVTRHSWVPFVSVTALGRFVSEQSIAFCRFFGYGRGKNNNVTVYNQYLRTVLIFLKIFFIYFLPLCEQHISKFNDCGRWYETVVCQPSFFSLFSPLVRSQLAGRSIAIFCVRKIEINIISYQAYCRTCYL